VGKDDSMVCSVWCLVVHNHTSQCNIVLDVLLHLTGPVGGGLVRQVGGMAQGPDCLGISQHDIVLKVWQCLQSQVGRMMPPDLFQQNLHSKCQTDVSC
jgi:hypothetical protein